jgi:hypothetical protein
MSADLSEPIRTAIIGDATVTAELAAYKGSYPVFTRRPVPTDAPYPLVLISGPMSAGNDDGVDDERPILLRDVMVYGRNDSATNYLQVETIAFALKDIFHRAWKSISVSGWKVVSIISTDPNEAPVDDDDEVGRRIELTVTLAKLN